tara:strand:- start:4838 stop:5107 length:270 start_codon:yes stop_codon:yes gene_type:complete
MSKNSKFAENSVFVLALVLILSGTLTMGSDNGSNSQAVDTCSDGVDNDGDGYTDGQDSECNPNAPFYDGDENDPNAPNQPPGNGDEETP